MMNLERNCRDLIEILTQHFPGGTDENHENPQKPVVPAEIRTEHYPDTRPRRYRYVSPHGMGIKRK
jgi:hypothetical protein